MYSLHYVGPKVEISQHGTSFVKSKEDKYIYLAAALEILKDLEDDFTRQSCHSHTYTAKPLDINLLHRLLTAYDKGFEKCIEEELADYRRRIEEEKALVDDIAGLTAVEREAWLKNIDLMTSYRLQRMVNKCYYEHTVEAIVEKIREKMIERITVIPDKIFLHLLHSVKNSLALHKPPVDATITEDIAEDGGVSATLHINVKQYQG